MIADGYIQRVFTRGSFLVDGFVRGAWKMERKGRTATLLIEQFETLSRADRAALGEEAARLADFAGIAARGAGAAAGTGTTAIAGATAGAGTGAADIRFIARTSVV